MATRPDLPVIRAARAGQAAAQLALGRRYLFGGAGLPRNPRTALYWLDRAACQQQADAWMLIGRHVPFEVARECAPVGNLYCWYERAYDAGSPEAGLVYARLTLQDQQDAAAPVPPKAMRALDAAARAGLAEAQWLLAVRLAGEAGGSLQGAALDWMRAAAAGGLPAARSAMQEQAWKERDFAGFLQHGLEAARALLRSPAAQPGPAHVALLARCAEALLETSAADQAAHHEARKMLERAAHAGERRARYLLGLQLAHIGADGKRRSAAGSAQFKKAIRWLEMAAVQGIADAWFALYVVYRLPECSQRSLEEARSCRRRAAEAGHAGACHAMGVLAWRRRAEEADADVEATRWLQRAAAQGDAGAADLMRKICAGPATKTFAPAMSGLLQRQHPLLAARLELAAMFGLTQAEALLIDLASADRGHCLLIDIRAQRARSRRRIVMVEQGSQRQLLDRIGRKFENIDCGPQGPEGNYRQRLYRFKVVLAARG